MPEPTLSLTASKKLSKATSSPFAQTETLSATKSTTITCTKISCQKPETGTFVST